MLAACIEEKAKYNLSDLTDTEFNRIIFAEAEPNHLRGISDAFTMDEVKQILDSEAYPSWSVSNQNWLVDYFLNN